MGANESPVAMGNDDMNHSKPSLASNCTLCARGKVCEITSPMRSSDKEEHLSGKARSRTTALHW